MLNGDVLERFHVTRPLARGGMGELWLAKDDNENDVVLKTVRDDLLDDVEIRRCFCREIFVTARLKHAHIVHHIAHGSWAGVEVLALEHIRGVSLADLLATSVLTLGPALRIAEDIARALAYLHTLVDDRGAPIEIVHGDVSPQNVLIDTCGQARLIDFGGALIRGKPVVENSIVGKPGYVSPEQAQGDRVDGRSDQYSLGIVLWEMLAGRELFEGDAARRARVVPPLSSIVAVPSAIEAAVVRMLAYDRDARFANAEAAADAIGALRWAYGIGEGHGWLAEQARHPPLRRHRGPQLRQRRTRPMRRSP